VSNFFHPPTRQRAAKQHRCIWCGQLICKGDLYARQSGVWEGDYQTNLYHPECFDNGQLTSDFDDGFMPHENERPPTAAELEYRSWNCAALAQGRLL